MPPVCPLVQIAPGESPQFRNVKLHTQRPTHTDADAHHIPVPGESVVRPKAHVFQLVRAALDHHRSGRVLGLLGIV